LNKYVILAVETTRAVSNKVVSEYKYYNILTFKVKTIMAYEVSKLGWHFSPSITKSPTAISPYTHTHIYVLSHT